MLERKTLNRVYRGHILFMGMPAKRCPRAFEGFVVEIDDEISKSVREHWIRALKYSPMDERQKPMQRYLQRRAIDGLDESILRDLRFEERSFDRESCRWYPAMLAAVRDVIGQLVTLHRTLLTPDG